MDACFTAQKVREAPPLTLLGFAMTDDSGSDVAPDAPLK